MRILLTGASSFTGYWFARELARAQHEVVAPVPRSADAYSGVRADRVGLLSDCAEIVWSAAFGEARFLDLLVDQRFDVLCHHAANVRNYRSPDFDISAALIENTRGLPQVLRRLKQSGLRGIVLTGSFFEPDEGAGTLPLAAFSPYGVSKALTATVVRYWCGEFHLPLGKFVIPNPFGPWEEARLCSYLVSSWSKGETAEIRVPDYVRDNIHVDLLAKAYVRFTESVPHGPAFAKLSPSGYVETLGCFAHRVAAELAPRLGLQAKVRLCAQQDFSEPMVRINTDPLLGLGWSETAAWDGLANFYRARLHER
jgi:nucleoside-diphosphate-sugar epimerase